MMKLLPRVLASFALAATTTLAVASTWPERPVRMIVPYPPGGATDFSARAYADELGRILNQPFVVENKAGAAGEIGAQFVASSKPDGYTVLMGALGSLAINSLLPSKQQQYDFPDAFDGVSLATLTPLAVVVRSDLPVENIQELIALAKKDTGQLSFGSAGYGSSQHMVGEKFQLATGTKFLHVPYKGSGPALTDLIGGQVDMVFDTMPTLMGHANNPKLRFLAVTTKERAASLPDIPTLEEQGVNDFDVSTRYVLLAPSGTPKAIVEQLSQAMKQAAEIPSVQEAMVNQGADVLPTSPADTDKALIDEVGIWSSVVKNANLE